MPYERTMGLSVSDQETYAQYRAEIAPLLLAAGAEFRQDFEVSQTLKSTAPHPVNRLFTLRFPDRAAKDRFFADPAYREIRARLFDASVAGATLIADYDV